MSVDPTKLASVSAQTVFSRMTSAEICAMLLQRGDIASVPAGIPTRLRFDAILSWFAFNQGDLTWDGSQFTGSLLLTGTPAAVKASILAQFATGRLTFLTTYGFSAARVAELIETDAVNTAGAPLDTKIPVWATPSDRASFTKQNLVTKVVSFWSSSGAIKQPSNPTSVATQLAAQPPGCRVLHAYQLMGFVNAAGSYLLYDDQVDPVTYPRRVPWFDLVETEDVSDHVTLAAPWQGMTLVEIWDEYFGQLRAACDSLNVSLDWLMLDLEDVRFSWQYTAADWDAILLDPRRPALEAELGFSLGANGAAIVADWAGIEPSYGSPKAWRFNQHQSDKRVAHLTSLLDKFRDHFPESTTRITEYEWHYKAPDTIPTSEVLRRHRAPISSGTLVRDDAYGSINSYGISEGGGVADYFPGTGVVLPPFVPGNAPWAGFLSDMLHARHVQLSDRGNLMSWVAYRTYTPSSYDGTNLYEEVIHHLRVMGFELFGWQDTGSPNKPLSDALIESDQHLQYAGWTPDITDAPGSSWYAQSYLASSCDSAGRRLYRVTPKLGATATFSTTGGGFALTVDGSVVLSLPRVSSVTQTAGGYWVVQTNPTTPDTPATVGFSMGLLGILFGAVAIALGEKKWPRDTTLTKSGPGDTSFTRVGPGDTSLSEQT